MTGKTWGGRRVVAIRATFQKLIDLGQVDCCLCGGPILPGMRWDVDHTVPRTFDGALYDPGNLAPAHTVCNRRAGQRITSAKRRARRRRRAPPDDEPAIW